MLIFKHHFKQGLFLKRILLALFISFTSVAFSQSAINDLRVEFRFNEELQTNIPDVVFNIEVDNISSVKSFLITLGSTSGGTDYFSFSVNVDGSNLPQGVTLNVQGNKIIINTGSRSGVIQYYASVKAENLQGTYGEIKNASNAQ